MCLLFTRHQLLIHLFGCVSVSDQTVFTKYIKLKLVLAFKTVRNGGFSPLFNKSRSHGPHTIDPIQGASRLSVVEQQQQKQPHLCYDYRLQISLALVSSQLTHKTRRRRSLNCACISFTSGGGRQLFFTHADCSSGYMSSSSPFPLSLPVPWSYI